MEDVRSAFKTLTGKTTEISRWEGIIRIDHKEIDILLYGIVLYCFVLMGWSLQPNTLRPF